MIAMHNGLAPRAAMAGALAAALILGLAGCSGLRTALGLGKTAPDEFAVVRHATLAVPPNYELRPPAPGAARPQEVSPRQEARKALLGQRPESAAAGARGGSALPSRTPGERALLNRSGASETPINIREVVRIEAQAIGVQDRSFTDRLLFWKDSEEEGKVLDAAAEAERLRREKEGAEASAAESGVVIKRKTGGLFGDLF